MKAGPFLLDSFRCTACVTADGVISAFDEKKRLSLVQSAVEPMAKKGLRTIAIAYRELITGETSLLLIKGARCGQGVEHNQPLYLSRHHQGRNMAKFRG